MIRQSLMRSKPFSWISTNAAKSNLSSKRNVAIGNYIIKRFTKEEAKTYETNWQAIYNVYRNKCKLVCPDVRELANILVVLCYEKYPNKFKKFLWHMAGAGVVENIKPVPVQLPVHDPNGEYEYLGQRYSLAEPKIYEARVK